MFWHTRRMTIKISGQVNWIRPFAKKRQRMPTFMNSIEMEISTRKFSLVNS